MPLTYATVAPGALSPRRPVPPSIARPEYVDRPGPVPFTGPEVKDPETIERMRGAGRIAADAMAAAAAVIAPGVTTDEIDRVGHEYLLDHGAYPSTLGYKAFPKSLCTSVNEVICHGIPDSRRLEDGDIVNIDITAFIHGVHGDTDATYLVGDVDEESRLLVERTHAAMMRGIKAAPVDLATGEFAAVRLRSATPEKSTPKAVAAVVAQIAQHFEDATGDSPIGVTVPAVVVGGVVRTAANIDPSWIGTDAAHLLSDKLG